MLAHSNDARSVHALKNPRLAASFPEDLLRGTKFVIVDAIDYPPLERLGIPEFKDRTSETRRGVTFKDTYFLQRGSDSEDLHFHELVHVVQWQRLGPNRFLLAYGIELATYGDRDGPLESIAYSLQQKFYEGFFVKRLTEHVEVQADLAWAKVERIRRSYELVATRIE